MRDKGLQPNPEDTRHDLKAGPRALRSVLSNFVTGVTVVTAIDLEGRPRGFTANSFTSVSLAPPLILVCIANSASILSVFEAAESFSVNVLSEGQRHLCEAFAARSPDRFAGVDWARGTTGAPRLAGSLAYLDCRVESRVPAGDHMILIGRIEAYDATAGRPLVFGQGGFIPLAVQQAAVTRPVGRQVVVGCIAEYEGRVLLERSDAGWVLPRVGLDRTSETGGGDLGPLKKIFRDLYADVEITFLYSVYESVTADGGAAVHIVYRGELAAPPAPESPSRLFAEDEVPWDLLAPLQPKGMLRRFFRERAINQFGVYSDVADEGQVARLQGAESFSSYLANFQKDRPR